MAAPQRFALARGIVLGKLDTVMRDPTQDMLDALNKAEVNLADESEELDVTAREERGHVLEHMLGKEWWTEPADKQQYFIAAYRKALELALNETGYKQAAITPRPIRTLWFRGADQFEMSVVETEHEITVYWLTPAPPAMDLPAPRGEIEQESIWAIAPRAYNDRIAKEFEDAGFEDYAPPDERENTPDVSVFQLIHY